MDLVWQDALNPADLKFAVGTTEAKMDMALGDAERPCCTHTVPTATDLPDASRLRCRRTVAE